MSKQKKIVELDLDQRVRDSEAPATSVQLPLAVHRRLDVLAGLAENVAATRKEIIGMLIADSSLDRKELQDHVVAYREKTNGQVIPEPPDEPDQGSSAPAGPNVVRFEKRGAGRPRREAG